MAKKKKEVSQVAGALEKLQESGSKMGVILGDSDMVLYGNSDSIIRALNIALYETMKRAEAANEE